MVTEKSWEEFRSTGLVFFINQILHIFGWTIIFEMENESIKRVYPARVKFRGFEEESVDRAYSKISKYMKDNASDLYDETNS